MSKGEREAYLTGEWGSVSAQYDFTMSSCAREQGNVSADKLHRKNMTRSGSEELSCFPRKVLQDMLAELGGRHGAGHGLL